MSKSASRLMIGAAIVWTVLSYGFTDPHLMLLTHPVFQWVHHMLTFLVYKKSHVAAIIYVLVLAGLFFGYGRLLRGAKAEKIRALPAWVAVLAGVFLLSFPALSYDIFNYIATAKVTFLYRENPYVVMPIEIPNEPGLVFTRAANKLALYGPTWIVLTSFPHLAGAGNIASAILSFKLFVGLFYAAFSYMIYRKTKRWDAVVFFALNPLVLLEVLGSGHNDIVMMTFALAGLLLWHYPSFAYKAAGMILFAASILVKGATVALLPLFFLPNWKWEKKMLLGALCMFGVFLLAPLREELYPWYAIWWLSFAAFIPIKKTSYIHDFSFWVSMGLSLGYVPWIATREYGGITPLIRTILIIAPLGTFALYHSVRSHKRVFRLGRKKYIL